MTDARTCPTCRTPIPPEWPEGSCPRCMLSGGLGPSAPTPGAAEVEAKLPAFEILSVLGQGGMGVVFKARQKALDRVVALKVLPSSAAAQAGFAERFAREAKALARLTHPNIVAVHDFGQTDGLFWLVMEFVDGANLRQAMRAGEVKPKDALAIVPQICDALQYAHEHGVVHRDIKPENVLLDATGRVKVADFGLAKLMERDADGAALTRADQVMGTPHYMAPEQVEHPADVDHRADIYSLGVVFYEMLTGELPLGRFPAPSVKSGIDARIDEIVLRTLAKERAARYQQVSQVKTDVGRAAAPKTSAAVEPPKPAGPVSMLAVAGVCGVPAAIIVAFVADQFTHRTVPALTAVVMVLFAGWVASLFAWWRIRRSGGRLSGLKWAAAGAFLPFVAGCVVAPFVVFSQLEDGERAAESEWAKKGPFKLSSQYADIDESAEQVAILGLWARLQDAVAAHDLENLYEFYSPDEAATLRRLDAGLLARLGAAGEIGFPFFASQVPDQAPSFGSIAGYRIRFGTVMEITSAADGTKTARVFISAADRLGGAPRLTFFLRGRITEDSRGPVVEWYFDSGRVMKEAQ